MNSSLNFLHVIPTSFSIQPLEESFQINPHLFGDVIALNDFLQVGPIQDLNTDKGLKARKCWLQANLLYPESDFEEAKLNSWLEDERKLDFMNGEIAKSNLCIWVGNNPFDQLMLCRLMHSLRPDSESTFIIPVSQYPLISSNNKTRDTINVLNALNIVEVSKHLRQIRKDEIDQAIEIWENLAASPLLLRTLGKNSVLEPVSESVYDNSLLRNCTTEYQPASRIIGRTLLDIKSYVNDDVLNWRLKLLCQGDKLQFKGSLRAIRDYEVRLKTDTSEVWV